ncbi:BglG family transcription antiterminator [Lihuaxuella thermophila]|uniref:Ascorbate-specific PTS system EIIA component n=1 Tax=Lihuaxuella thermophila TaxID=1173111 RepID=A0A1H8C491_9BACL|nr:BglG family transcription antiterminator [Lihuaxuella thermophila]SEM89895.1 Transcriptional antiterminator [Lihuaxuella thermophila]
MQLDQRSIRLLQEIISLPGASIGDLERKLRLSRRQIQYDLDKINGWLNEKNLPPVQYDRQQGFRVDPSVANQAAELQTPRSKEVYILTDQERARFVLLLLLAKKEHLSLLHISSALQVSRNTALNDIKKANRLAGEYGIQLRYSRSEGYFLNGLEWNRRRLLASLIRSCLSRENGEWLLSQPLGDDVERVQMVQRELERIENQLQICYTDERLAELAYEIVYTVIRIQTGNRLSWPVDGWQEVVSTAEYGAMENLFHLLKWEEKEFPEERAYFALQLLATNMADAGDDEPDPHRQQWLDLSFRMIEEFEKHACVELKEKEKLARQIFQHLRPAYFRVKFGLELKNPLCGLIMKEHSELHHLVKKAMEPFVRRVGRPVSDDEMAYVTMHFGSWLRRQGMELASWPKAVVVCPKGVAISKMLFIKLKEMFPDLLFLDSLSVREFYKSPFSYDIVFSTVFVRTEAMLFIVNPIIDKEEEQRIYREVMQVLYGFSLTEPDVPALVELIGQYADIRDADGLAGALRRHFKNRFKKGWMRKETDKPVLDELITEETVQLADEVADWQEAVRLAAQPLLENGSVEPSYVEAMIRSIQETGPYVVITPKVAIPHARPEEGVNILSMSLLRLKQSVLFGDKKPVHLVIVLAATDGESHLRALAQLTELLSSEENIDRLIQCEEKAEIMKLIHHYSKGETFK